MTILFGTDGVRGTAGQFPLDPASLVHLGWCIGSKIGNGRHILMGTDTRESGLSIASHLGAGLKAAGIHLFFAGVLPTPAIAALTREDSGMDGGIVISASHNPYEDNGIKVFHSDGTKLPVTEEEAIEELFLHTEPISPPPDPLFLQALPFFADAYIRHTLHNITPFPEERRVTIVVDSAHGATSEVGEHIFSSLPIDVIHIGNRPNGMNINDGWGSQHPSMCRAEVLKSGAWAGFCFDGDGDRLIVVDEMGEILTGDHLLYALARSMAETGELPERTVVATVMSNGGLERALSEQNIRLVRCPVGDRNVWEAMIESGSYLGGEQSGHIINRHISSSGDGLLNALHILKISLERGEPIGRYAALSLFPQKTLSLNVQEKVPLDTIPNYHVFHAEMEERIQPGRLFIRYSGTERKLRIMVETRNGAALNNVLNDLTRFFSQHLRLEESS